MTDRTMAAAAVEESSARLYQLSQDIHSHPEMGLQEVYACARQTELLRQYGFTVETPYCGGETAYCAVYHGKQPGPKIAFLAEYDALPEIGHGCGHNLICTTAIGGAIAARGYADDFGGTLYVFGTPAEETNGYKVILAERGIFDDIDAAILVHPAAADADFANMMAMCAVRFTFHGRPAHAAGSPEEGVNALDAMISFFTMVNALRQETRPDARIHGIITKGGVKANIIPDLTEAEFYVRGGRYAYMEQLTEKVKNCARGAALGAGCTVEIEKCEATYKDIRNNQALAALVTEELELLGVQDIRRAEGTPPNGSSDVGDVSYCCPAIHAMMGITGGRPCALHTPEFAACAGSREAFDKACLYMQATANAAGRLLSEPETLAQLKAEFNRVDS